MKKKTLPFVRVYCPELQGMIHPGEWAMCPYFSGTKKDFSDTEDALKQIFRCHVQCGCEIQYQYYDGDALVTKSTTVVEDPEQLRKILALVAAGVPRPGEPPAETAAQVVLLADDDPDFLEMNSAVLKNKGYEVIAATSAAETLEKLAERRPDVVVLDVMMESFDAGFTACKKIKEQYPDLPVMLLTSIGAQTGLDFSSNEEVLKLTGADALLDKPVSPKVFIDALAKLTRQPSA
jgi:CheY-like chemotaxis protein